VLLTYDDQAQVLYLRRDRVGQVRSTGQLYHSHGLQINLDRDKDGNPLGVEIILNGDWAEGEKE